MMERFVNVNVWRANPARFKSMFKISPFDDMGTLHINSDQISYDGKSEFIKGRILDVSLERQVFNWPVHILMWMLVVGVYLFVPPLFERGSNFLEYQKVEIAIFLVFFLVFQLGVMVAIIWSPWVKIKISKEDDFVEIYLSDAKFGGWRGILGGNRKLFRKISELVVSNTKAH